ncbi:MAG: hypothetical protein U9N62_05435 [Thermotogota bacterium]|nr:hypothetical protein [Thermotogota bacterium]
MHTEAFKHDSQMIWYQRIDAFINLFAVKFKGRKISVDDAKARETNVKDITPVKNLTNVIWMYLNSNLIEDITPIVDGLINTLKRLDIRDNELDLTPGSDDMINIQKLENAGIDVRYE